MRYCADTWFFVQLGKQDSHAIKLMEGFEKKRDTLIVPSIIVVELVRRAIRTGKKAEIEAALMNLKAAQNVLIADCTFEVASKAGELSATYDLPSIDAIVAATTIIHKCHRLLSEDAHFDILQKQELLKKQSW